MSEQGLCELEKRQPRRSRSPVLYLLIGPPGSGKSTAAAGLCAFGPNPHGTLIFSTDDFFVEQHKGADERVYLFSTECEENKLHLRTLEAVRRAAARRTQGTKPDLVVHNTFLYFEERAPYYELAKENGYELKLLLTRRSLELSPLSGAVLPEGASLLRSTPLSRPVSFYAAANQHGVPATKLEEMVRAFARFLRGAERWSLFGGSQLGDHTPLFFSIAELLVAGASELPSRLHRLQDLLSQWNPKRQDFGDKVARLMCFMAELETQAHLPAVERRVRGLTLFCQHFLYSQDSRAPVWFYCSAVEYVKKAESCFWNGKQSEWLADLWNSEKELTLASCYAQSEFMPFCSAGDLEFMFLVFCARCSRDHDEVFAQGVQPHVAPKYENTDHLRRLLGGFLRLLVYQERNVAVARLKEGVVVVLRSLTRYSEGSYSAGEGDGDRTARLEVERGAEKGELVFLSRQYREELVEVARVRFASPFREESRHKRLVVLPPRSRGLFFYKGGAVCVPAGASRLCFLEVPYEELRRLVGSENGM